MMRVRCPTCDACAEPLGAGFARFRLLHSAHAPRAVLVLDSGLEIAGLYWVLPARERLRAQQAIGYATA